MLGPKLDNGQYIYSVSVDTPGGVQAMAVASSAYECCTQCLIDDVYGKACEYSIFRAKDLMCGRYLNPAVCPAQSVKAGGLWLRKDTQEDPSMGFEASNGPCGSITS